VNRSLRADDRRASVQPASAGCRNDAFWTSHRSALPAPLADARSHSTQVRIDAGSPKAAAPLRVAEPAVLSRLAVCCRLSLGSHWGVRPDDWRVHFHSGRGGRGRRFPLQICTTEFTNPTGYPNARAVPQPCPRCSVAAPHRRVSRSTGFERARRKMQPRRRGCLMQRFGEPAKMLSHVESRS